MARCHGTSADNATTNYLTIITINNLIIEKLKGGGLRSNTATIKKIS